MMEYTAAVDKIFPCKEEFCRMQIIGKHKLCLLYIIVRKREDLNCITGI